MKSQKNNSHQYISQRSWEVQRDIFKRYHIFNLCSHKNDFSEMVMRKPDLGNPSSIFIICVHVPENQFFYL